MDNGFEAVKKNLRGWSFYPLKPWEGENLGIDPEKSPSCNICRHLWGVTYIGYILIVSRSCYTLYKKGGRVVPMEGYLGLE